MLNRAEHWNILMNNGRLLDRFALHHSVTEWKDTQTHHLII